MILDDGTNIRPAQEPEAEPDTVGLAERVAAMTVADVLAAVRSGDLDPGDVCAAESAGRRRSTILDAVC